MVVQVTVRVAPCVTVTGVEGTGFPAESKIALPLTVRIVEPGVALPESSRVALWLPGAWVTELTLSPPLSWKAAGVSGAPKATPAP